MIPNSLGLNRAQTRPVYQLIFQLVNAFAFLPPAGSEFNSQREKERGRKKHKFVNIMGCTSTTGFIRVSDFGRNCPREQGWGAYSFGSFPNFCRTICPDSFSPPFSLTWWRFLLCATPELLFHRAIVEIEKLARVVYPLAY